MRQDSFLCCAKIQSQWLFFQISYLYTLWVCVIDIYNLINTIKNDTKFNVLNHDI